LIALASLMKALGNPDENPNDPLGVDLAQIGLGAPPRPLLAGMTPRPSGLGLDGIEGCFCFLFSISALSLFHLSFADV
jgi:hypothetical protein